MVQSTDGGKRGPRCVLLVAYCKRFAAATAVHCTDQGRWEQKISSVVRLLLTPSKRRPGERETPLIRFAQERGSLRLWHTCIRSVCCCESTPPQQTLRSPSMRRQHSVVPTHRLKKNTTHARSVCALVSTVFRPLSYRIPRRRQQQVAGRRKAHGRDAVRWWVAQLHLVGACRRHSCCRLLFPSSLRTPLRHSRYEMRSVFLFEGITPPLIDFQNPARYTYPRGFCLNLRRHLRYLLSSSPNRQ